MVEVGQDFKAHLTNTETLKPFSQGCRAGGLGLLVLKGDQFIQVEGEGN